MVKKTSQDLARRLSTQPVAASPAAATIAREARELTPEELAEIAGGLRTSNNVVA